MKFKWDGKSRPTNKAYDESWNRIFGKNKKEKVENIKMNKEYKKKLLKHLKKIFYDKEK